MHFPKLNKLDLSTNIFFFPHELMDYTPKTFKYLIVENTYHSLNTSYAEFLRLDYLIVNSNLLYKLTKNTPTCVKCFDTQYLTNLKILSISNCSINIIENDAIKGFENLTSLNISKNALTTTPKEMFFDMPALEILDISETEMVEIPDLSPLLNLRQLHMNTFKNIVNLIDQGKFDTPLEKVEILSLKGNNLRKIMPEFLENFPNLKELDLSYNRLNDLPDWPGQNKIIKLNLSNNKFTDVKSISSNFKSLETLELCNNLIKHLTINDLIHLPVNLTVDNNCN